MASFSASKRRLAFRKCHTSPSLLDENQNVREAVSEQPEGSNYGSNDQTPRFSSSETRIDDIACSSNLANETKVQPTKLSRLKILLSPRNPYEEFHKLFKDIPKNEFPMNDYSCALSRDILLHGRLFLSQNWLCFYSNIFGFETVVKLECRKIKSISRAKTAYMFPNAILVRTEKKKYLFCSFLMRDAAHKLMTSVWQKSKNNNPDSGLDEVSNNGDQDEESVAEEVSEFNENKLPIMAQNVQSSEDPFWGLNQHRRTTSCPNTPLSHHPSSQDAIDDGHEYKEQHSPHSKEQDDTRKTSSTLFQWKYLNRVTRPALTLLNSLYSCGTSVFCLFKRNQWSAEVFLLFSFLFLIVLLMSTFTLMDRISKLEKRFQITLEGIPEQRQTTEQLSAENLRYLLKQQEANFHIKTNRLYQALNVLLRSVKHVKTKLKLIKDELTEPNDCQLF